MDWIEKLFHISPDGGNGTTELLFILIPLLVAAAIWRVRRRIRG